MERGYRPETVAEVVSAPSMIAEDTPVFESGDGVLDTRSAATVPTPGGVATHATAYKPRCDELVDAAIAAAV